MEPKAAVRRYELDWLRVLAFTAVFFYHCSRFFDSSWWHIKNSTSSALVDALKSVFDLWGMPLLFFISGASIAFALRPGRELRFVRDRAVRLLAPLALGILVLAPPQIYLTKLTHGDFQGSFLDFLPLYFGDWPKWSGNFAWSGVHLWYLEDLFLFSLALLPLFAALQRPAGWRAVEALARFSAQPGRILLWLVPFVLWITPFDPLGIVGPGLSEDVARLIIFPAFVVFGYLVFGNELVQQSILRQRRLFLALSLGMTLTAPLVGAWAEEHSGIGTLVVVMFLVGVLIWTTLLAIVGYALRYLTGNHRLLAYANEAVLPIYVLHQPVILLIGYFIIPLALPIAAKYLIILTLALSTTLALYEFGVRRWNPIRQLFGLKARVSDSTTAYRKTEPAVS